MGSLLTCAALPRQFCPPSESSDERTVAYPGGAWRAHDPAHFRPRLPDRAAPQRPEPRADEHAPDQGVAAEQGDSTGAVQRLRGAWRCGLRVFDNDGHSFFEALANQVIDAKQRNERAHCFCGRSPRCIMRNDRFMHDCEQVKVWPKALI